MSDTALSTTAVHELLTRGLNRYQQRLCAHLVDGMMQGYVAWRKGGARQSHDPGALRGLRSWLARRKPKPWEKAERREPHSAEARHLFDYTRLSIHDQIERLSALARRNSEFRRSFTQAASEVDQRRLLLDYAAALGASRRNRRGDAKAIARWFGEDTVLERYLLRRGEVEQQVAFGLQRLGQIAAHILETFGPADRVPELWGRLELERTVHDVLAYVGDSRLHVEALKCLTTSFRAMPPDAARSAVSDKTIAMLTRKAVELDEQVWLQCEAIELLGILAPDLLPKIFELRLGTPGDTDDMFVRRRALRVLAAHLPQKRDLAKLLTLVANDPSPFVRQEMTRALAKAPTDVAKYWMHHLAREDTCPQVRAAQLVSGLEMFARRELHLSFLEIVGKVLDSETDDLVLRTALHVASEWLCRFQQNTCPGQESEDHGAEGDGPSHAAKIHESFQDTILPSIRRLQSSAESVAVRRWAANAGERIWLQLDVQARGLYQQLRDCVKMVKPGRSRRLPRRVLRGFDPDLVGRVLAVLAQEDFGLDIEWHGWGDRMSRGPVFRFRWWRLWYEFCHAATDKRQAFQHTIGRVSQATLRAPSGILAELSETKVPGEPLFLPDDNGWRPYLPLVDDLLSALDQGLFANETVRFYTSQGCTELTAPPGWMGRWLAALRLTVRFPYYARLRNWQEKTQAPPTAYLDAVKKLGFQVRLRPYQDASGEPVASDSSVLRFFPCLLVAASPQLFETWRKLFLDYAGYFTSLFENSLTDLFIFAAAGLGVFLTKHLCANGSLRRARNRIPLAVGGWGTRGKSGTERLKGALINGLGYSLFSKSSGCEAMFLQGPAYGDLRELPLYRPYDKATIWEHRNVLLLASHLNSSVFLWECMGLTPAYVDVLQRQWTRDDLATITNTYPDHEDLQGPAGLNVAQVIAGFIPRRSRVATTEQQMYPVLEASAQQVGSELRGIGWLESGLLTPDVLDRFPYKEHPDNIALVLAMAEELGCDADFALKEMADRMVPDLGVLKTYPQARLHTRTLEFTNGMSANERFGCLGNWTRMGFDQHDPHQEARVWITTVVNNRADRVARSRVFANILARDVDADRHFLIGGNLKGLQGFIWEAWEAQIRDVSLWSGHSDPPQAAALDTLGQWAMRYRQPTTGSHVQGLLDVMLPAVRDQGAEPFDEETQKELRALWESPDRLAQRLTELGIDPSLVQSIEVQLSARQVAWREYQALADRIRDARPEQYGKIDGEFRQLLRTWFARKLVVIENYYATGEQIIHRIAEETPPGCTNRIMGMQNIKGTGLDFVYRWQAWEKCHEACTRLLSPRAAIAQKGLSDLADFQDFGLLCDEHMRETIHKVQRSSVAQREQFQAELEILLSRLTRSLRKIRDGLDAETQQRSLWDRLLGLLEKFLDVNDAIRRRKKADLIYRDLSEERISRERAALELRALNKRQKGGWLTTKLPSRLTLARLVLDSPDQAPASVDADHSESPSEVDATKQTAATHEPAGHQ